ncbi:MAG: VCBS repeat-containing protein, partial [Thermoplasmata archaeon]|nr:VCBS repeat-containing protein [Thermoplasmata archaeon]
MTGGGGTGAYDPYPPLANPSGGAVGIFYPNAGNTGYQDHTTVSGSTPLITEFEDLNNDGYIDILVADASAGAMVYWGDSSGTFSPTSKTTITTTSNLRYLDAGDFDGDGWYDLAVASSTRCYVFLNDGAGSFSASADVEITNSNYHVRAGDVNGDGFDDLVLSYTNTDVFYGGPDGPETTSSVTLAGRLNQVKDLDQDGYDDVLIYQVDDTKLYMGSSSGPDNVADYSLSGSGTYTYYPDAGDINGDGYIDIVAASYHSAGSYKVDIFDGGSDGWKTSRIHSGLAIGYARCTVGDIDKDGYEDIVISEYVAASNYKMHVYKGGSSWPTSPSITKSGEGYYPYAIAIPKGGEGGARAFRGTFTTEEIDLPMGKKWDLAYLDGSFPQNTSTTITVLDSASGSDIAGFKDVRRFDLDLSGVDPDIYRSIKLKVSIETEFNTTTPVVDSLTVKWMDKRVWRDEFYGDAKVERMLNMGVAGGQLGKGSIGGQAPQLIFPTLMGEANYTTSPLSFSDAGGLDYVSRSPFEFKVKGTSAADVADVDGDGYLDIAFSVKQTAPDVYGTLSPLFMGGPLGMQQTPQHRFDTTGATDVVLEDIDGDGHVDVIFAQMMKAQGDYAVNSTLYWGSVDGWSDTPDLEFGTKGASSVEAVDMDGDDDMDLVFACYRDSGTSTDSMVFLQGTEGFCATAADYRLPTKGATAVAAGDIDDDGYMDLVFANNLSGGFAEIDSWVYWGKMGGGFEASPLGLATKGATDVKVADLD